MQRVSTINPPFLEYYTSRYIPNHPQIKSGYTKLFAGLSAAWACKNDDFVRAFSHTTPLPHRLGPFRRIWLVMHVTLSSVTKWSSLLSLSISVSPTSGAAAFDDLGNVSGIVGVSKMSPREIAEAVSAFMKPGAWAIMTQGEYTLYTFLTVYTVHTISTIFYDFLPFFTTFHYFLLFSTIFHYFILFYTIFHYFYHIYYICYIYILHKPGRRRSLRSYC